MITKKEFIGKQAEIVFAGVSFTGKILDETKNTIILETKNGVKKIIKKNAIIIIDDKKIKGEDITKRPEDRIKAC